MDPTHQLPAEPPPEDPLTRIPGIEVDRVLGRGGMGLVLHGRQTLLKREVAVKVLKPGGNVSAEFEERFRREAQILADVKHPNIVSCYHADTLEGASCYIVMEFVRGPNLREWIGKQGPLEAGLALEVCRSLARALDHAYQHKVIHRDVKPENVLLEPKDGAEGAFPYEVKLADLGLARYTADTDATLLTSPGAVMGTPATMAPEQFTDPEAVDFRADIYGLGCVLYYTLTGHHAFTQPTIAKIFDAKKQAPLGPDPREDGHELPPGVVKLVRRMMARNPDERPPSYDDLIATCGELLYANGERVKGPARLSALSRLSSLSGLSRLSHRGRRRAVPVALGLALLSVPAWWALSALTGGGVEGAPPHSLTDADVPRVPTATGTWAVRIESPRTEYKFGETVRLSALLPPGREALAEYRWAIEGLPPEIAEGAAGPLLEFDAPTLEDERVVEAQLTVVEDGEPRGRCTLPLRLHPNRRPRAQAGTYPPALAESEVVLVGRGADPDPSDAELLFQWEVLGGRMVKLRDPDQATTSFRAPKYEPGGANEIELELRVNDGELIAHDRTRIRIVPIPLPRGESRDLFREQITVAESWTFDRAGGIWQSFAEREEDGIEQGIRCLGYAEECDIDYTGLPGGEWRLEGTLWLVREEDEICDYGGMRFDCGPEGIALVVRRDGGEFVSRVELLRRGEEGEWVLESPGEVRGEVDDGGRAPVSFMVRWTGSELELEWGEMHRESVPVSRRPELLTLLAGGMGRVAFDKFVLTGE